MKKKILLLIIIIIAITSVYTLNQQDKIESKSIQTGRATTDTKLKVEADCYWDMHPGWNHLSHCTHKSNYSINSVFSDIKGDYRFILKWNKSKQEFEVYSPKSAEKDFKDFKANESVFIFFEEEEIKLDQEDDLFDNVKLLFSKEWNSASYPFVYRTKAEDIANNLNDCRFILKWNESTQKFDIYSTKAKENDFKYIGRSEAFMAYLETEQLFDYEEGSSEEIK